MDTRDPNEPDNYGNQQPVENPEAKPDTKKEESESDVHPLIALIDRYLQTYPYIERQTAQLDYINKVIEFRVVLSKYDRDVNSGKDNLRKNVK